MRAVKRVKTELGLSDNDKRRFNTSFIMPLLSIDDSHDEKAQKYRIMAKF